MTDTNTLCKCGHEKAVHFWWDRDPNCHAGDCCCISFTPAEVPSDTTSFQDRVKPWMLECFGPVIPFDKTERNHRFLEEALELVQSLGCTADEAHQLVDYVFGRPEGEPSQEVGGTMVTLAALCIANALDMDGCAETELARIWTKVELIRAKQAAKPKHSPLPQSEAPSEGVSDGWRDIASAPFDGSYVLCFTPEFDLEDQIQVMRWTEYRPSFSYWQNAADSNRPEDEWPTHWMPLPNPPVGEKT